MLDAYTKGLVASATPCFGYYSQSTPACADCPISSECLDARLTQARTMIADMQAEAKARAAARAAIRPAADPGGESFDDILDSIQRPPELSDLDFTAIFGDLASSPAPPSAVILRAVSDTACGACGKTIVNGSSCQYIQGQLLRHEICP